jgi:hypothetical protein
MNLINYYRLRKLATARQTNSPGGFMGRFGNPVYSGNSVVQPKRQQGHAQDPIGISNFMGRLTKPTYAAGAVQPQGQSNAPAGMFNIQQHLDKFKVY